MRKRHRESRLVRQDTDEIESALGIALGLLSIVAIDAYFLALSVRRVFNLLDRVLELLMQVAENGAADVVAEIVRTDEQAVDARDGGDFTDMLER